MNKKRARSTAMALKKGDYSNYVGSYEGTDGKIHILIVLNNTSTALTRLTAKMLAKRINQYLEYTK